MKNISNYKIYVVTAVDTRQLKNNQLKPHRSPAAIDICLIWLSTLNYFTFRILLHVLLMTVV